MSARAARLKACITGQCSFCGRDVRDVGALIGSSVTETRICDPCLGICCDVLARAVGERVEDAPASAWSSSRISETVAKVKASAAKGELAPPPTGSGDSSRCSFCLAAEHEVAKLIAGAGVYICERCVADAAIFNKPAVRWLKRYWGEEGIWFFLEVDADGWVLRQVELQGAAETPIAASALAEWHDVATRGLEAVQAYEATYGRLADQPMSEQDLGPDVETLTREAFEDVWHRARAQIGNDR